MNIINKNNTPELRFPDFQGEWVQKTIEDLFEFKNGLNKEKEYFGKGTPIINFKDVFNYSELNNENIKGLVEVTEKEAKNFGVKKGDVFFTRTSETIEEIGIAAALTEDIQKCVFSGFVLRARPKSNMLDDNFKKYCFSTQSVRKEIVTKSSYTTRALTSGTLLNKVKFVFPQDLHEQQKIASFFTAINKKISQLKRKKALLEEYKKGVMQKTFAREIRFKDDNGRDFPEWEKKRLGEITNIIMGQSPDSKSYNNDGDGVYLIQGNADILDRGSNPRVWTNKPTKRCVVGDILMTVRAPVGYVAKSLHDACIGRGMCVIKHNKECNNEFLFQFLLDYEMKWIRLEQGSTFTAVNGSDIKGIDIDLPTLNEQTKIANFLSSIDKKISHTQTQIEKAELWKKGLLQKMFV